MAKKYDFDDSDGVWRTVGGRRIFIRNGQDLASAMKESGKFKKKDNDEYELYKKAREDESSIDPMTENSTDWEALDKKYRDRYEREQRGIKEISYIGQDNKEHKMNSYDYPKDRDSYHEHLKEKYGTYKEEEIIKKDNGLSYAKLRNEFYDKQDRIKLSNIQETNRHIKNATSQKSLKSMANAGYAKDITNNSFEANEELREKHGRLERVKTIKGAYGINGAILRSRETGEYFVITARNSNIDYWV